MDTRGSAVTPSAVDAARHLGLELTGTPPVPSPSRKPRSTTPAAPSTPTQRQRVAIGADHGGLALKDALVAALRDSGHPVQDLGTTTTDPVDYPDFALAVARAVAAGAADAGIMIDGAGIGSCMVANKVPGVRAAMCHDITTASSAREHNNANLLTLGGTLLGQRLALDIVRTFLSTAYAGGRHDGRVAKIDRLDAARR